MRPFRTRASLPAVKQNGIVWEVVKISTFNDIPHVQIMQVDDPTEHKLISARTLRDDYDLAPE